MRFSALLLAGMAAILLSLSAGPKSDPPPGTVPLNDTLYIDRMEITNIAWREYEHWTRLNDTAGYESLLPDTALLGEVPDMIEERYQHFYYRHPGSSNYPVLGVTYAQAQAFCRWRSERVNEFLASGRAPRSWKFKKVTYRLPTEAEWELAARGKLDTTYPYGMRNLLDPKKGGMINAVFPNTNVATPRLPAPVDAFRPNGFGIYQMCGNAAEMVQEPGIAKGGHYWLEVEKCRITDRLAYKRAEAWLGFRCVAVVEW